MPSTPTQAARQVADAIDRARNDRERRKEGPKQPMSDAAFEAMARRIECGE